VFTARRTTLLLVAALAYYTFVIGGRGLVLLRDERPAFRGLGAGLLLLDAVGVALVAAEVRFGARSQRLARLRGDTAAPARTLADADAAFDVAKAAVEAAPEDWRAWYDLAVAYGDARDTRRGRAAMRRAIALERAGA
jgi:hypothetical protein